MRYSRNRTAAYDICDFSRRHRMLLNKLNYLLHLISDVGTLGGEDGNSAGLQMGR